MSPTSHCVILVPVGGAIDPGCEDALRELERRGYVVWRVRGFSAIDAARNQMANDALAQRFDELMWIDSDIVFDPDDVDRLRRRAGCDRRVRRSFRLATTCPRRFSGALPPLRWSLPFYN